MEKYLIISFPEEGNTLATLGLTSLASLSFFNLTWRGKQRLVGVLYSFNYQPPPVFLMFKQSFYIEKLPSPYKGRVRRAIVGVSTSPWGRSQSFARLCRALRMRVGADEVESGKWKVVLRFLFVKYDYWMVWK